MHGKGSEWEWEWKFKRAFSAQSVMSCVNLYIKTDAVRLLDTLWNIEPVEMDEGVGDLIAESQTTVSAMLSHSAPTKEDPAATLDKQPALHYRSTVVDALERSSASETWLLVPSDRFDVVGEERQNTVLQSLRHMRPHSTSTGRNRYRCPDREQTHRTDGATVNQQWRAW